MIPLYHIYLLKQLISKLFWETRLKSPKFVGTRVPHFAITMSAQSSSVDHVLAEHTVQGCPDSTLFYSCCMTLGYIASPDSFPLISSWHCFDRRRKVANTCHSGKTRSRFLPIFCTFYPHARNSRNLLKITLFLHKSCDFCKFYRIFSDKIA